MVVAVMLVVGVASASLATVMLEAQGAENYLTEPAVADGPWLIEWGRRMQAPLVEQASQVGALRLVVGGAATLVATMCLLIVAGLWRQRLLVRRAEYFVHWAVGARRLQRAARGAGEGQVWAAGAVALSVLGTGITLAVMERTFPGDASVPPNVAVGAILLTALGVVLVRWESSAGPITGGANRSRAWELLASPPVIGAVGFAVVSGVGLLALHAPYASSSMRPDEGVVIAASLARLPVESRGEEILAWRERVGASGARIGLASAGASRAAGHVDHVTVECGRCSEGGIPMPLKFVRAEVHAVAPDTFVHLGVAVTRGRDFDNEVDRGTPSAAIVSQALANRHFERGLAVGRRLRIGESDWLTVVGIVGDRDDVQTYADYAIYLALAQVGPTEIELLADIELLAGIAPSGVGAILAAAPPGAVLGSPRTWAEVFAAHRWFRTLLNALGVAALGLLGAGLWVSARNEAGASRYEVAVRRAVGASRRAIWTFYLSFSSRRVFPALVAGAWLSLFLGAGLSEAYGSIPQIDWAVWAGAATWVSAMYVLGSAPPFLRAAHEPLLPTLNQSSSDV